jgi:hypothetical protein
MGSSIAFYCGDSDLQSLQTLASSLGLRLQAPAIGQSVPSSPADGPFCFLSMVPESELHPYGNPPVRITDARDPILRFIRPYFSNPFLVVGHIHWSNDAPELARRTKADYQRLARWIRKEWIKDGDFYIGPEAHQLVQKGAQLVAAIPEQATFQLIAY